MRNEHQKISKWEKYSVEVGNKSPEYGYKVGCVLTENGGTLVATAYENEIEGLTWCEILLSKLKDREKYASLDLYLTVNTLDRNGSFALNDLLSVISVNFVDFGMPDPCLCEYRNDDPITISKVDIARFPDDLKEEIVASNISYYRKFGSWIGNNSFFEGNRISQMLFSNLKDMGYEITNEIISKARTLDQVTTSLVQDGKKVDKVQNDIEKALSEAFNLKYGAMNGMLDARMIDRSWIKTCKSAIKSVFGERTTTENIIIVGVGNGNEAKELFGSDFCGTMVDVASSGMEKLSKTYPNAKFHNCRAEDLPEELQNTFDIYLSLRSFNSAFFDVSSAVKEAKKVLKEGGRLIVSIANAFVNEVNNTIIPGLLLPRTNVVDLYRGIDFTRQLENCLRENVFEILSRTMLRSEIFVIARCHKSNRVIRDTDKSLLSVGEKILEFTNLISKYDGILPDGYKLINPYVSGKAEEVHKAVECFYREYYSDSYPRRLMIGSNPSRRRSAITGIPFEDPSRIYEKTGISLGNINGYYGNDFFDEIKEALGGDRLFYQKYYLGFLFPLGIERMNEKGNLININYYDNVEIWKSVKSFVKYSLEYLLTIGIKRDVCVCIGTGKNYKYLTEINNEEKFFDQIIPLEHPRYIMQYHSDKKEEYKNKYIQVLSI